METILIAGDHAGFELKRELIPFMRDLGYAVTDMGAFEFDAEDDYPDFIAPLAREISKSGGTKRGVILGGSGQGEAIVANRFPHVRAIVFNGQYKPLDGRVIPHEVVTAREHNDANIISLGARFLSIKDAKEAVKQWLTTPFTGDVRHVRRLEKIDGLHVSQRGEK